MSTFSIAGGRLYEQLGTTSGERRFFEVTGQSLVSGVLKALLEHADQSREPVTTTVIASRVRTGIILDEVRWDPELPQILEDVEIVCRNLVEVGLAKRVSVCEWEPTEAAMLAYLTFH